jgi:uncharacterized protein
MAHLPYVLPSKQEQHLMWHPSFLNDTQHRPFTLQTGHWIMPQRWEHLLFYHWPVPPELLAGKLPAGVVLETWQGQAWLGMVPFVLSYMPRGLHVWPYWLRFNELNLRTYVRYKGKPGVYFLTLEADELFSIVVAKTFFHLAYQASHFKVQAQEATVSFSAKRSPLWNRVTGQHNTPEIALNYGPLPDSGIIANPTPLEHFLTERYCFFSANKQGHLYEGNLHHSPWPLQPAWCDVSLNTLAGAFGLPAATEAPLLHYCRKLEVVAWPIKRLL